MKVSKDATNTARRIFRLCQTTGLLDEAKLRIAIRKIVDRKPRGYRGILHVLHRLVRKDVASRHVTVESAQPLGAQTRDGLVDKLKAKHGDSLTFEYIVNPELIGGIRVKLADDVWDGSIKARLERIANAF